jgi:hypothetical protein
MIAGYKIVLRVQDHISWPALLDLVLRRTIHKCCVASVGRIASAAGAGMPISPRQKALPIRGRASADPVDGLRRTQPVYLNMLTRAGPAGWGQPRGHQRERQPRQWPASHAADVPQ